MKLASFAESAGCAEVPIVDESRSIWMQSDCRHFGEQSVALDVAVGA